MQPLSLTTSPPAPSFSTSTASFSAPDRSNRILFRYAIFHSGLSSRSLIRREELNKKASLALQAEGWRSLLSTCNAELRAIFGYELVPVQSVVPESTNLTQFDSQAQGGHSGHQASLPSPATANALLLRNELSATRDDAMEIRAHIQSLLASESLIQHGQLLYVLLLLMSQPASDYSLPLSELEKLALSSSSSSSIDASSASPHVISVSEWIRAGYLLTSKSKDVEDPMIKIAPKALLLFPKDSIIRICLQLNPQWSRAMVEATVQDLYPR